MQVLSPGYWQEQDLELGTLAPLDEALSSTVWSSPDMLASQGEKPGPSSQCSPDASHPSSHHLPVVVPPPHVLTPLITTQLPPSHLTFSPQFRIHHHISMHQLPLSLWHRDLCNPTPLSKNKMPGRNGLLKNKEVLERHCQRGILQVRQGQRDLEVGD